ncbi:MAG TPA: PAS domain S-box protein [Blastocatellia bacterium]|nr:PAS domain S-box protein [Blastocatellia bacterium]
MLVEDYETTRRATAELLRRSDYEVIEAATGTEALRLAHEVRPQVMLLDVDLPDLSGIEVCQRIKADPATATTLVLQISGRYTGSNDKAHGLNSGADGYLIKPVETTELLAVIRAMFRLHQAEADARRMQYQAEASANRFRDLIDGLKAIVWEADARTRQFTFVSRRAEEMLGFPCARWLHEPDFWISLIHPADRKTVIASRRATGTDGRDNDLEYRVIAADGREVWLRDLIFAERNDAGEVVRLNGVMIDITQRKLNALALHTNEERFRAIFDQVLTGIAQTDLTGRFTLVNQRYCEIVGRTKAELLILKMQDITHPHDLAHNLVLFEQMLREGTGFVIEKRYVRPDGSQVWVNNSVSLVRDKDAQPVYVVAVVLDVTAQKQAQIERDQLLQREQRLRQQAEEVSRHKDEFLAALSHELRSPLHLILGNLRILRTSSNSAEGQRALDTAFQQTEKLRQVVLDLLDTAEVVTGKMRLKIEPLDFIAIIEAVLETVQPAAKAREIRISKCFDHKARVLTGDPLRLRQIVWNLLSNAIRFTPRGGEVEVRLNQIESEVELVVSDTGIGIHPEFLPFVFDRFRQADGSSTRKFGGLGLGLAVVRHLVELHGGCVTATSEGEGQGATFTVRLPLSPLPVTTNDQRLKATLI